jgi:hypothetical protein
MEKEKNIKKKKKTSEERENERKGRKNEKKENKGRIFFHFSFVPNMFPSSSQWVPIKFPMCSPRGVPNPICFAQVLPFSPI